MRKRYSADRGDVETMTEKIPYEKYCPLIAFDCKGSQCAFANAKHKSTVDKDGNMRFENDGWYCLVRDFLVTIASRK